MRALILALSFFLLAPVLDAQETSRSSRPTVAVKDFQMGTTVEKWWEDGMDVGKGIADMLLNELINSGSSLRLLERNLIDEIMREQDLANSDRFEPSAGDTVKVGKMIGAQYLITGSITRFGTEDKKLDVSGVVGIFTRNRIAAAASRVSPRSGIAHVEITVRVVDNTTGVIVKSVRGYGKSKRSGLLLGGLGVSGGGAAGGQFEMGGSNFRETILGEATSLAVSDLAAKLIAVFEGSTGSNLD